MNFFYHIGLYLYLFIAHITATFNKKAGLFYNGRKNLISKIRNEVDTDNPIVWFHCASVGEFEQARPLIEAYRNRQPDHKILLTFFSPSGYELRKNYSLADWVYYLPMDTKRNSIAFIEAVKPAKAIFIKYEFWFNYLYQLKMHRVPTYIVSAIFRPEQAFFKWYGNFFRRMLKSYTMLFVQDEPSANLLKGINVKNVVVCGDTRFDRVLEITAKPTSDLIVEKFLSSVELSCVAGSTWLPDEEIIFNSMETSPYFKLIIAPHEVEKENIARIEELFSKYKVVRYSQIKDSQKTSSNESIIKEARILIIDTIGILSSLYRYGNFAYIGGGFGVGIHNILEAATYKIPVVFGPNFSKFREARELVQLKGASSINGQTDFTVLLNDLLKNEKHRKEMGDICERYVQKNIGATEKILKVICS